MSPLIRPASLFAVRFDLPKCTGLGWPERHDGGRECHVNERMALSQQVRICDPWPQGTDPSQTDLPHHRVRAEDQDDRYGHREEQHAQQWRVAKTSLWTVQTGFWRAIRLRSGVARPSWRNHSMLQAA